MRWMSFGAIALVSCVVLAAEVAHADEGGWGTTFEAQAAGAALPAGDVQIVVIAAGEPSDERDAAAAALVDAWRASGKAQVVLDDASLGEVGEVDDAAAVARARALPVTHVAVLRVAGGEPPKVLVSVYARAGGASITAFVATRGVVMSPPSAPASVPGAGVSEQAMSTVDEITEGAARTASDAQTRYDAEFVGYDDVGVTDQQGATEVKALFYKGKFKAPLEGAEFYRAVGRPDLASSYENRKIGRYTLIVGGTALALGGLLYMTSTSMDDCDVFSSDYDACESDHEAEMARGLEIGLGLGVVGTVASIIGLYLHPDPVDTPTRRELADTHNKKLEADLGMTARAPHRAVTFSFTPVVSAGYQGLVLQGRF